MTLDMSRFSLLSASDHEILAQGVEVLVVLTQMNTAIVHFPAAHGDAMLTGIAGPAVQQWRDAAVESGAIVVDARPCDPDEYLERVIHGPMVAVGASRARLIDGTRSSLSHLAPQDYARSFAAIGAIIFNVAEPQTVAARRAA